MVGWVQGLERFGFRNIGLGAWGGSVRSVLGFRVKVLGSRA